MMTQELVVMLWLYVVDVVREVERDYIVLNVIIHWKILKDACSKLEERDA